MQNFIEIHLVEVIESEPKWWTNKQNDIATHRAVPLAWLKIQLCKAPDLIDDNFMPSDWLPELESLLHSDSRLKKHFLTVTDMLRLHQ